jgi:hypothetical protein
VVRHGFGKSRIAQICSKVWKKVFEKFYVELVTNRKGEKSNVCDRATNAIEAPIKWDSQIPLDSRTIEKRSQGTELK